MLEFGYRRRAVGRTLLASASPDPWSGPALGSAKGALRSRSALAHRVSEMRDHHRHLIQRLAGCRSRESPAHAIPAVHQSIVDGEHLPFECGLAFGWVCGVLQKIGDDLVIAIQRFAQPIEIHARYFPQAELNRKEAELVRRSYVGCIIPGRLRAQDQEARITEPVSKQQDRACDN